MRRFVADLFFLLTIATYLLIFSLWTPNPVGTDFIGVVFRICILLGSLVLLFHVLRGCYHVFAGKLIVKAQLSLDLLAKPHVDIALPSDIPNGRIVIFLERTKARYVGSISACKLPGEEADSVVVELPPEVPVRSRISKWLPTSDAGSYYEHWGRFTGKSTNEIILNIPFAVKAGQLVRLSFDLNSNFIGTKMEKVFPIKPSENISLWIRS